MSSTSSSIGTPPPSRHAYVKLNQAVLDSESDTDADNETDSPYSNLPISNNRRERNLSQTTIQPPPPPPPFPKHPRRPDPRQRENTSPNSKPSSLLPPIGTTPTTRQPRPRNQMGMNVRRHSTDYAGGGHRTSSKLAAIDHFVHEMIPAHARKKKDRKGKQRLGPSSLFEAYETYAPNQNEVDLADAKVFRNTFTGDHQPPMTSAQFGAIVESVRTAIRMGIQPTRISQGSSGSYFCRNPQGQVVGVFKPKNEEPYGHLNPKWTKWIHRNCFPCCFGRSCLIPNLGYASEAAASLIDRRLGFHIVPRTEVVFLSSPAFHYSYMDRRAALDKHRPRPLPEKIGSFQIFLHNYRDANVFLREYPWPETPPPPLGNTSSPLDLTSLEEEISLLVEGQARNSMGNAPVGGSGAGSGVFWTAQLMKQFREQFERLVILDYLIRNTDRGLDNWMVKFCEISSPSATPPSEGNEPKKPEPEEPSLTITDIPEEDLADSAHPSEPDSTTPSVGFVAPSHTLARESTETTMTSSDRSTTPHGGHIHLAAIDNGLAFPWKHPDRWRSYPYGWLFLSASLVDAPFSQATRDAVLPILTSPQWWRETVVELRRLFSMDSDFDVDMFERQAAILKGQGWNVVEILRRPNTSPNHLVRRVAVAVWEEEVVVLESDEEDDDWDDYGGGYESADEVVVASAAADTTSNPRGALSEGETPPLRPSADGPRFPQRRRSAEYPSANKPLPPSSSSRSWRKKLKTRLSMDQTGFSRDHHRRRRRRRPTVRKRIIERLEEFTRARPWFTCC